MARTASHRPSLRIGILSTYVPRECGIATFAQDMMKGIVQADDTISFTICAISDGTYSYPREVAFEIDQHARSDYRKAAQFFNESDVDVVVVQHEFGIFGGYNGSYLLDFLRYLTKPVAIVLHTVPMHPSARRRATRLSLLRKLFVRADCIFVTIPSAADFFAKAKFSTGLLRKIRVVPHGAPLISAAARRKRVGLRRSLGVVDRATMMLTYGLLTPNKGIHFAVRAMKAVVDRFPDTMYVIAGRMHPSKTATYLADLQRYINRHGLQKNTVFLTRYLSLSEILELLAASDIYIVPYLTKGQVSSGTVAYAVAAGKAIIATKFSYALDTLANGRGILVDFSSSRQIADAVLQLIEQPRQMAQLAARVGSYGRRLAWDVVGTQYLSGLTTAIRD